MNPKLNTQFHKNTNLKHLFESYITYCQYTKNLREQTIKSYREVFKIFQKLIPELQEVSDLQPQVMNEFYRLLSTRERIVGIDTIKIGVKPSTIRTYHNKLIAFFSWLENYNHVQKGTLVRYITKPPLPRYEDDKALSDAEISKIIATITIHSVDDSFMFKRDMLIVTLFLYTGIRKGELIGLRVQDIDFENRTLYVFEKTSKSKKSRYIPLHPSLIKHLKVYLKERKTKKAYTDALIISLKRDCPLTHYGLVHWVRKYKELSGVKFHVHRFRHTFACTLAKQNADLTSIMRVLGHSSMKMTERYLRSITAENSRSFIEKMSY